MRREWMTTALSRREMLELGASAVAAGAIGHAATLADPDGHPRRGEIQQIGHR